jgi:hypothetical protein
VKRDVGESNDDADDTDLTRAADDADDTDLSRATDDADDTDLSRAADLSWASLRLVKRDVGESNDDADDTDFEMRNAKAPSPKPQASSLKPKAESV